VNRYRLLFFTGPDSSGIFHKILKTSGIQFGTHQRLGQGRRGEPEYFFCLPGLHHLDNFCKNIIYSYNI
jgi:hypothetical protein